MIPGKNLYQGQISRFANKINNFYIKKTKRNAAVGKQIHMSSAFRLIPVCSSVSVCSGISMYQTHDEYFKNVTSGVFTRFFFDMA